MYGNIESNFMANLSLSIARLELNCEVFNLFDNFGNCMYLPDRPWYKCEERMELWSA